MKKREKERRKQKEPEIAAKTKRLLSDLKWFIVSNKLRHNWKWWLFPLVCLDNKSLIRNSKGAACVVNFCLHSIASAHIVQSQNNVTGWCCAGCQECLHRAACLVAHVLGSASVYINVCIYSRPNFCFLSYKHRMPCSHRNSQNKNSSSSWLLFVSLFVGWFFDFVCTFFGCFSSIVCGSIGIDIIKIKMDLQWCLPSCILLDALSFIANNLRFGFIF